MTKDDGGPAANAPRGVDLETRLSRLRAALDGRVPALGAPFPAVTLMFSVSDGAARAVTAQGSGATIGAAWDEAAAGLHRKMARRNLRGRFLRLDWIEKAETWTWGLLRKRLREVKRNYSRRGIALDADFTHLFLEQELNGNAMFYGGNRITHALVNEKNFLIYAQRKYGSGIKVDFSDEREVHVLDSAGLFCGEDGIVHELHGAGRNAGRRKIGQPDTDVLSQVIGDASNFLSRQVDAEGRFIYGYHPCFDRQIPAYNALRHASTTYSMLEAWELTREPRLLAAIKRALEYLCRAFIRTAGGMAFVVDTGDEVKLGANATAILAMSKYASLVDADRYAATMEKLALGVLHMQARDGSFTHVLNWPDLAVKEKFRIVYYEGEAAFALMRLYSLTKDGRWIAAVEKAFEHFIEKDYWQHHDHWLGYCTNELTLYRPELRYFRFGIQNFDGFLDFVLQRITTFPTLLEMMMAGRKMLDRLKEMPEGAQLLAGVDEEKFNRAMHFRAAYLLNGYFWPEYAMFFRNPDRILGSFFIRHHAFRVRIDDVEHYLSGLVAYREYLKAHPACIAREDCLVEDRGPSGPVVTWGGDINLGRRQHYRTAELGAGNVLDIPAMKTADLRIANLECVVSTLGEQGVRKGETSPYYYRARPEMVSVLTAAGIDIVATANNHSGDYGPQAVLDQGRWLDAAGIGHCGTGADISGALEPVFRRAGNLNIAVFSIDATQPRFSASQEHPGAAFIHLGKVQQWRKLLEPRIARARRKAHVVLVAVHWGDNLETVPGEKEIAVGHALIDAGADAVLGASAHVLQGVEIYKDRPIIHDAGDFLFDAVRAESDDSGLFSLELGENGVERLCFTPLHKGFGFTRQRTGEDAVVAAKRFARLCRDMGTPVGITSAGAGIIDLTPPVRAARRLAPVGRVRAQALAERDFSETLESRWTVEAIPEACRIDPIRIGPLTLLGVRVDPARTTRRCMLWVETFWTADEAVSEDYRLDIRAVAPASLRMRPWGESMDHDPCDWMMPTSRWKPGRIYRDYYGLRPPRIEGWRDTVLDIVAGLASRHGKAADWVKLPCKVELALPASPALSAGSGPYRTEFAELPPDRDPAQTWNADQLEYVTGGKWLVRPPQGWFARSVVRGGKHIDMVATPVLFVASEYASLAAHENFSSPPKSWDTHRIVTARASALAGAIVSRVPPRIPEGFPLLLVEDPVKALIVLGLAARSRFDNDVIAITGTSGKSTTVGMLAHVMGVKHDVSVSFDNYNSRVGAPASLANLSRNADAAIVEVAQSALWMKRGPVTRLVRPTIALITEIGISQADKRVKSVEDTVKWKTRIFDGLTGPAIAVVGEHLAHFDKVKAAAIRHAKKIVTFGESDLATLRIVERVGDAGGSLVRFLTPEGRIVSLHVPLPGIGMANNGMAAMGVLYAMGHDLEACARALGSYVPDEGRLQHLRMALAQGGVTDVIDDSWNATVSSMLNAFSVLADSPAKGGRKIAVLGRIVHLGDLAQSLHESLAGPLLDAAPDLVVTHGDEMRYLRAVLPERILGPHFPDAGALAAFLGQTLRGGDLVLVKGSRRDSDFGETVRLLEREMAGHRDPARVQ